MHTSRFMHQQLVSSISSVETLPVDYSLLAVRELSASAEVFSFSVTMWAKGLERTLNLTRPTLRDEGPVQSWKNHSKLASSCSSSPGTPWLFANYWVGSGQGRHRGQRVAVYREIRDQKSFVCQFCRHSNFFATFWKAGRGQDRVILGQKVSRFLPTTSKSRRFRFIKRIEMSQWPSEMEQHVFVYWDLLLRCAGVDPEVQVRRDALRGCFLVITPAGSSFPPGYATAPCWQHSCTARWQKVGFPRSLWWE